MLSAPPAMRSSSGVSVATLSLAACRSFASRAAGSLSAPRASIIFRIAADCFWIRSSGVPSAAAMRWVWRRRTSAPGTPVPASMTTKATSLDWLAASGPTTPPSLWPRRPILSLAILGWALRNRTPASASWAKSAVVESGTLPVEPPTPRSSARSTAIPWRLR